MRHFREGRLLMGLALTASLTLLAAGGNEVGANGDALSAWFVARAKTIADKIDAGQKRDALWAKPIRLGSLRAAIATVSVVMVDDENRKVLESKFGPLSDEQVVFEVANGARQPLIALDRETWTNFYRHGAADSRTILHLYLEAASQDDRHFRLSSRVPFDSQVSQEAEGSLDVLRVLPGAYSLPVPYQAGGFAVIHSLAWADRKRTDTIEAHPKDGTLSWQLEPRYDGPVLRDENFDLRLSALSPASDGGYFAAGTVRTGCWETPFVLKVSREGKQEWLHRITHKVKGPFEDYWERVYENPFRILEYRAGQAIIAFERRLVLVDEDGYRDLTDKLTGDSDTFVFQDLLLTNRREILIVGGKEDNEAVTPFLKLLSPELTEVASSVLSQYPRSFFSGALGSGDSALLLLMTTMDPTAPHFSYRQTLLNYRAGVARSLPSKSPDYVTSFKRDPAGNPVLTGFTALYDDRNPARSVPARLLPRGWSLTDAASQVHINETSRTGVLTRLEKDGTVQTELPFPGRIVQDFLDLGNGSAVIIYDSELKLIRLSTARTAPTPPLSNRLRQSVFPTQ